MQQKRKVYSCQEDCLLSSQHTNSLVQSSTGFSIYMVTLKVQHLRSSVLNIQHLLFVHKRMLVLSVNGSLVVLGVPVSTLGLTLGVLVLALDVTLQILGSTLDGVIVVDGLVDYNCANGGSDSKQYLRSTSLMSTRKDTTEDNKSLGQQQHHLLYVKCSYKPAAPPQKTRREKYTSKA